ncbi:MAG: carbohydrate kinase family protein [Candidatus Peregrinibacteria bacterium]
MKKPTLFSIGSATFDIFVKPSDQAVMHFIKPETKESWLCLRYGGKVKIDHVTETFGGGATNTAVAFARMGFEAHCVSKIGAEYGDKVLGNLKREGVNTDAIAETKEEKTGFSTILSTIDGDRTVLGYAGANHLFSADDLPLKAIAKADWIFLSHVSGDSPGVLKALTTLLKKHPAIKLAWNPGHEQFAEGVKQWKDLLARTEILFVNKEEAALFTGIPYQLAGVKKDDPRHHVHTPGSFLPPYADDVSEIMVALAKCGVKNVVITDGRNGAQTTDGTFLYFCPVVTQKRTDTLGAGDAFASGFVSARIFGKDLDMALKYGTLNANSVVGQFGAQKGLLTRKQIEKNLQNTPLSVPKTKLK